MNNPIAINAYQIAVWRYDNINMQVQKSYRNRSRIIYVALDFRELPKKKENDYIIYHSMESLNELFVIPDCSMRK